MKNIKVLLTVALLCALTLIVGCSARQTTYDRFSVGKNEAPVTVWLNAGDRIERNRKLYFSASQDTQIKIELQGNYKIISQDEK